ncbi:MAG TPA: isoprenylcysteine carboxylmethyltransferase family protein [Roseiarcus sp.]|jgi:protein-S-isoprenylcysteine O-methyltransferase Ste14
MLLRWFFQSYFLVLWVGWLALWIAMARKVKAAAETETWRSRLSHVLPLLIAAYLLAAPNVPLPLVNERFVPLAIWPAALGAALMLAGVVCCVWARFTIADNWSGEVEIKREHELVVDGPYRWVRHPIYTGLLLMFLGTALAVGEWRGLLAVALAALAFWRKLGLEEAAMRRQFGAAYVRYAARVPALIPFMM